MTEYEGYQMTPDDVARAVARGDYMRKNGDMAKAPWTADSVLAIYTSEMQDEAGFQAIADAHNTALLRKAG